MTLINRFGIVHGTDSNVIHHNAGGRQVDIGTKLFPLGETAGLTIAGNWHIDNGFFMDYWMENFVENELADTSFSLRTFARHLAEAWNEKIPADKRQPMGNWAHIAGYERIRDESHPEFWAVTNITAQSVERPTAFRANFGHWEDLSTYDCRMIGHNPQRPIDLYAVFAERLPITQRYQNGHGDGRLLTNVMAYFHSIDNRLGVLMEDFLSRSPETRIAQTAFADLERSEALRVLVEQIGEVREPIDIESSVDLVRRTIQLIGQAFLARGDEAVGGEPQVLKIAQPEDMCRTNHRCPIYSQLVIDGNLQPEFSS